MPKLTNQKKLNEWSELYLGNFNACLSDFLMQEIADKIGTDVDIATDTTWDKLHSLIGQKQQNTFQ